MIRVLEQWLIITSKDPRTGEIIQLVKCLQQTPLVRCICRASNGEVETVKFQSLPATQLDYLVTFRPVGDPVSGKKGVGKEGVGNSWETITKAVLWTSQVQPHVHSFQTHISKHRHTNLCIHTNEKNPIFILYSFCKCEILFASSDFSSLIVNMILAFIAAKI